MMSDELAMQRSSLIINLKREFDHGRSAPQGRNSIAQGNAL